MRIAIALMMLSVLAGCGANYSRPMTDKEAAGVSDYMKKQGL